MHAKKISNVQVQTNVLSHSSNLLDNINLLKSTRKRLLIQNYAHKLTWNVVANNISKYPGDTYPYLPRALHARTTLAENTALQLWSCYSTIPMTIIQVSSRVFTTSNLLVTSKSTGRKREMHAEPGSRKSNEQANDHLLLPGLEVLHGLEGSEVDEVAIQTEGHQEPSILNSSLIFWGLVEDNPSGVKLYGSEWVRERGSEWVRERRKRGEK